MAYLNNSSDEISDNDSLANNNNIDKEKSEIDITKLSKNESEAKSNQQSIPLSENVKEPADNKVNGQSRKEEKETPITEKGSINIDYRYALKNGRVGQLYSDEIDFNKVPTQSKITEFEIKGLEQINGLSINKEKKIIEGIPEKSGVPEENYDFHLEIIYITESKEKGKREISIKILPDPKSLWKNLEPPPEIQHRKPHEAIEVITFIEKIKFKKSTERQIIAASKRGRSHAHNAKFRDDHFKIAHLEKTGWSIITVADGAGSAELSRIGSEIACEKTLELITNQLYERDKELNALVGEEIKHHNNNLRDLLYNILVNSVFQSVKSIEEFAKKENKNLRDFHTTMLVAICKKIKNNYFIAGCWIGDGALAIYNEGKEVILLGKPDSGEFSGQTKFITMKEIWQDSGDLINRIKYHIVPEFTSIMAMSDGVSDPLFETENNLNILNYWDTLWNQIKEQAILKEGDKAQNLLEWLDFWVEGEHDDRTIALLY